jgi:hypothetical protein
MVDRLIRPLIDKYASKYIEPLAADSIKVGLKGLWNGEVQLKNLIFKENVFLELNLPLRVRYSYIGDCQVKAPYTAKGGISSLTLKLENVYLIL